MDTSGSESVTDSSAADSSVVTPTSSCPGDVLKCPSCGKEFSCRKEGYRSNYARHLRVHSGERPYLCEECDATFTTSTNLNRHKVLCHGGERRTKRYRCDDCGKNYACESSLRQRSLSQHLASPSSPLPSPSTSLSTSAATVRAHVECPLCTAPLSSTTKVRRHMQFHCPMREYSHDDAPPCRDEEDSETGGCDGGMTGSSSFAMTSSAGASETGSHVSSAARVVGVWEQMPEKSGGQPTCSFLCPVEGCLATFSCQRFLRSHIAQTHAQCALDPQIREELLFS